MKLNQLFILSLLCLAGTPAMAAQNTRSTTLQAPAWFMRDLQRGASWLPSEIRRNGIDTVYARRWASFPQDVQAVLNRMQIPTWLIALIPADADKREEILKQFRFMDELAGNPAASRLALRAEQLLIFGGAAQLPTPGDTTTGESLGAEGCTAAMSKYVLAELKLEFPQDLASMPERLTHSQSSSEMKSLFEQAARAQAPWLELKRRRFADLQADDVQPGSLMIAQKPGGTHVFAWTRVPRTWGWSTGDKMAIGNTGLPQFGSRMILAQEYLTDSPRTPGELEHNQHGPINSKNTIYSPNGRPNLSDSRTNVYAAQGSDFIIIDLR